VVVAFEFSSPNFIRSKLAFTEWWRRRHFLFQYAVGDWSPLQKTAAQGPCIDSRVARESLRPNCSDRVAICFAMCRQQAEFVSELSEVFPSISWAAVEKDGNDPHSTRTGVRGCIGWRSAKRIIRNNKGQEQRSKSHQLCSKGIVVTRSDMFRYPLWERYFVISGFPFPTPHCGQLIVILWQNPAL